MALSSKKIYWRKGGVTYSNNLYTTVGEAGTNYLAVRDGTTTLYAPAIAGTASNAFQFRKAGVTYKLVNSLFDIEPGTYLEDHFVSLVHGFITNGATRNLTQPITFRTQDQSTGGNLGRVYNNVTQIKRDDSSATTSGSGFSMGYYLRFNGTVSNTGSTTGSYDNNFSNAEYYCLKDLSSQTYGYQQYPNLPNTGWYVRLDVGIKFS